MDDDDRTFDALGRLAGPLIDQPPIPRTPLADLEQRARHRTGRRRATVATAVVLVLVGAGGLLARAGTPDTSLETRTSPTTELPLRFQGDLVIHVNPDASPAQVQAIEDDLLADPSVHRLFHQSRDDSYQDFRCLFADTPEMVESVTPEIMPSTFRLYLDGDPTAIRRIGAAYLRPGVRGISEVPKVDPLDDHGPYIVPSSSDASGTSILGMPDATDYPAIESCPLVGEWLK